MHTPTSFLKELPSSEQFRLLRADLKEMRRQGRNLKQEKFVRAHFYYRAVDAFAARRAEVRP